MVSTYKEHSAMMLDLLKLFFIVLLYSPLQDDSESGKINTKNATPTSVCIDTNTIIFQTY